MRITNLIAVGVLAALPQLAIADVDNAKADKLFEQALALRKVNPQQACAKFAEALTYNPQAIATHLNVAQCDEEQGRIASAAARYREIVDRAANQKLDDYKKEAQARLDAIVEDIPHLTLTFAQRVDGMRVVIDDKVVDATGKLEVDPGERKIAVSAPGRIAHVTTVIVARRDDKTIALPALERATSTSRKTFGKVSLISGGALFAASVGVALVASRRYNDAKDRCPADATGTLICTTAEDLSALDSARTLGNVGTVIGIVGLAAAAAGGVLWWTAPSEHRTGVTRVGFVGGANTAGVALHGRF